jgi:hypothetical protein
MVDDLSEGRKLRVGPEKPAAGFGLQASGETGGELEPVA